MFRPALWAAVTAATVIAPHGCSGDLAVFAGTTSMFGGFGGLGGFPTSSGGAGLGGAGTTAGAGLGGTGGTGSGGTGGTNPGGSGGAGACVDSLVRA